MKHLLKRAMLPILGALIATLAGCASSQPAASVPTPADVSGTWMGSTVRGASTMTLVLNQTGTNVTGTFTGAGTIDGPIEGTVEGNTIRLRERSATRPRGRGAASRRAPAPRPQSSASVSSQVVSSPPRTAHSKQRFT